MMPQTELGEISLVSTPSVCQSFILCLSALEFMFIHIPVVTTHFSPLHLGWVALPEKRVIA